MARLTAIQREGFEALRRAYFAQVPRRIAEIRRGVEELERAPASREALLDLRQLAHRLVGSAAIFGAPQLCEAARALERRLDRMLTGAGGPGALDALTARLESVWRTGEAGGRGDPAG